MQSKCPVLAWKLPVYLSPRLCPATPPVFSIDTRMRKSLNRDFTIMAVLTEYIKNPKETWLLLEISTIIPCGVSWLS